MTPEQIDRLINMVVTIGGAAAEKGFEIAMRRVMFLAYVNIGWVALFTLVAVVLAVSARRLWKHHKEGRGREDYDDEYGIISAFVCVASVVTLLIAMSQLVKGFDKLLNPEWHAVMMLMGLVK